MHRAHFSRKTHTRAASQQPSSDSLFTEQLQSSHLMPCRSHLLWIIFTIVSWSDDDFRLFHTLLCFNYNDMLLLRRVHTSSMLCIYAEQRQNDDKSGWWGREKREEKCEKLKLFSSFNTFIIYILLCVVSAMTRCVEEFLLRASSGSLGASPFIRSFFSLLFSRPSSRTTASMSARIIQRVSHIIFNDDDDMELLMLLNSSDNFLSKRADDECNLLTCNLQ